MYKLPDGSWIDLSQLFALEVIRKEHGYYRAYYLRCVAIHGGMIDCRANDKEQAIQWKELVAKAKADFDKKI